MKEIDIYEKIFYDLVKIFFGGILNNSFIPNNFDYFRNMVNLLHNRLRYYESWTKEWNQDMV